MDVFDLYAKIGLDKSEYESGLNEAKGSMSNLAKSVGNGLKTVAKVGAAAVTAAAAGVAALTKMSVEGYAEYEQLVGGVETLFKSSQSAVMAYAENAYKTAGMSANEYMSTVTSFSASLIQSLGGDTEKAAEVGNMAITDMSDNANKMGTSMEMIQNAYNGFAKQNYTMLDNLKLGYGGTKEEMQRLINDANAVKEANGEMADLSIDSFADVAEAIHIIQTEMGITGTTAKEAASTISGSIGMMKAAWQNLVVGMADENANMDGLINDFVESTITVAGNIMPRIEQTLKGIGQLVEGLAPMIGEVLPGLISSILPSLLDAAIGLVNSLVEALPTLINTLMGAIVGALPAFINAFVQIVQGIVSALPNIITALVEALPTLIPQLVTGLVSMVAMLCETLPQIIQPIIDYLPDVVISLVNALLTNLPTLIQGVLDLVLGLVEALPMLIEEVVNALPMIVGLVCTALVETLPLLLDAVIQIITALIKELPTMVKAIINALPAILNSIWAAVTKFFEIVPVYFSALWDGVKEIMSTWWESIKEIFGVVAAWFDEKIIQPVANFFTGMWNNLKSGARSAWEGIKSVFSKVSDWFKNVFSEAWQKVKDVFSTGGKVFDGIKEGIVDVFKTVVNAIIRGINKVIEVPFKAINSALKKISETEIMGIRPFDWIHTFNIPKIPELSTGLRYVPFDEYPAFLHRGEAVLTAAQARAWRNDKAQPAMAGGVTINQYIQTVPQTPVEFANATEAYFEQARWAL